MFYNSSMVRFALSDYVEEALALATYDKLEDNSFVGKIPPLKGVIAFGGTLWECENELRSTLEEWLLVGLKRGHPIPEVARN
jgi:predicted RNase H-like HicB family nuclease